MKKLVALMMVLSAGLAAAQTLAPEMPQPKPVHKFFNQSTVIWTGINFAAQTMDAVSTRHGLDVLGGRELNPLARPFETRGWPGTITYHYGINFGGTLALQYLLHKTGHHKLEKLFPAFVAPQNMAAAAWNFRHW